MSSDEENESQSDIEFEDEDNPEEVINSRDFEAEKRKIMSNQLPNRSRAEYEIAYGKFFKWANDNKVKSINESIMIVYFQDLKVKQNYQSSTLWSIWSKLRLMLCLRHSKDINNYSELKLLLRTYHKGHKAKQSKTFNWTQVIKFLEESNEHVYLGEQVILIYFC